MEYISHFKPFPFLCVNSSVRGEIKGVRSKTMMVGHKMAAMATLLKPFHDWGHLRAVAVFKKSKGGVKYLQASLDIKVI